jgi:hypothetical protein
MSDTPTTHRTVWRKRRRGQLARSHEQHARRILGEFENGSRLSQRSLSSRLGIALGLTNLLIRRMIRKRWIRVVRVQPNRMRYVLTPQGLAEKARMTRAYFHNSVRFYAEARNRIRDRFAALSSAWPHDEGNNAASNPGKRIIFYGAGEVAEIGYICLQKTDLGLVGVADDKVQKFFDVPVYPTTQLTSQDLAGQPYDRLVVMSFGDTERLRMRLAELNIPEERIFWF